MQSVRCKTKVPTEAHIGTGFDCYYLSTEGQVMYALNDNARHKTLRSPDYNFVFDKTTGFFARWGRTQDDDPDWSPFGPEILDLEISTGACKGRCRFCYKKNGTPINETKHMQLHEFEDLLRRMPPTLTQIAFGITDVHANPDFFAMMRHAREQGIIPNYTTHGLDMDDWAADQTAELCGAVAVSVNTNNKEAAYNTIKKLSQDKDMDQVNIHIVLAEDTVGFVKSVVDDIKTDSRLSRLNALVMLSFKDKGKTGCFSPITSDSYKDVVSYCEQNNIPFGFDSCSAHAYMKAIQGRQNYDQLCQCVEPCESGLFSSYINVDGNFFVCSFCENEGMWKDGLSIWDYDTMVDLWRSPKVQQWRDTLLKNERKCPFYKIGC